jgi:hypothetical protein
MLAIPFLVLNLLLLVGCSTPGEDPASAPAPPSMESVFTGLDAESCETKIDPEDPNQTKFRQCPGPAGYSLIVRRVASGRHSVDIVNPAKQAFPLDYQESVTRAMSNVTGQAEWRVLRQNGSLTPVALIVRLQAREDLDEPETVTATYVAIAKIAASGTCVTDVFPLPSKPEAEWRTLADTASERPCAPAKPPLADDAGQ